MARLLIVPGLHDSPGDHWQSWLQRRHRDAVRVRQRHWDQPDLDEWAAGIARAIEGVRSRGPFVAVAHSFGVLALLRHLVVQPQGPIAAALLVAPADPDWFGVGHLLPPSALRMPATLVLSRTDPWLSLSAGWALARRWQLPVVDLGNAGHINVESGHQRLPLAQRWVQVQLQRGARSLRLDRAEWGEWSIAV